MFTEIMKLIPKLDDKALREMERALQGRFTKIAKSFGKGLVNIFKGGGVLGIALGLLDKLLNPLKETQEAIDRMLKSSDDIATNATQFNTSTGRLFKLIQIAKANGLDQDNLFTLISKYQTAVAEARQNPSEPSVVRNFVDQQDTAAGFFEFIQALQKMDRNQQVLVQQQVFGEKQILRMADFLQADFTKIYKAVGLDKVSTDKLTMSIEKMANLNDLADQLAARRETQDVVAKAGIINEGMIRSKAAADELATKRENQRIAAYENLQHISQTTEKMMTLIEQGVSLVGGFIPKITTQIDRLIGMGERLMKSPFVRGIKNFFGGGE